MSKKLFLLFFVCVFAVFSVSPALAEVAYKLEVGGNGKAEIFKEDQDKNVYEGGNFFGRFRLPKIQIVSFDSSVSDNTYIVEDVKVTWELAPKIDGVELLSISSDNSGDYAILNGILPAAAEEDEDVQVSFKATAKEIDEKYSSLLESKTIQVESDSIQRYSFKVFSKAKHMEEYIQNYDSMNLENVTLDYSVTVEASEDNYILSYEDRNYIGAANADLYYSIDVPKWLKYTLTSGTETGDNEDFADFADGDGNFLGTIASVTITVNPEYKSLFKNGTKGIVRVPLIDIDFRPRNVVEWNVTLSEPLAISAGSLEFALAAGGDPVVKSSDLTGAKPVSVDYKAVDGITLTITSDDTAVTVTAQASSSATAGAKDIVLTFKDANGNTDTLTVKTTVTVPVTPALALDGNKALSLVAGEAGKKTTLTATWKGVSGKAAWKLGTIPSGLQAAITASTDKTAEITVSADSTATAGSKTVAVTATDSTNNLTATANIAVTVTVPSAPTHEDNTEDAVITDSTGAEMSKPCSSLKPGDATYFTISLENLNFKAAIWTLLINGIEGNSVKVAGNAKTSEGEWLMISNYSADSATVSGTVPSNLSSNLDVTMSITDTDGRTHTIDLGTVSASSSTSSKPLSSSRGGCDSGLGALALAVIAQLFICKKH